MGPSPDFYCSVCDVFDIDTHTHDQKPSHRSLEVLLDKARAEGVTAGIESVLARATRVDVDGILGETPSGTARYIGEAVREADGTWTCLADIHGALCRVAVNIRALGRAK
jgi:hypothetical protein